MPRPSVTSSPPAPHAPGEPLPASALAMLASPVLMYLATRAHDFDLECTPAFGAYVVAPPRTLRIFVPEPVAARTRANVQNNGEVALLLVQVTTHKSIQLKGRFLSERIGADADERAAITRYLGGLTDEMGSVGVPRSVCERFVADKLIALDFEVRDVFIQTPGPAAGQPLATESAP
jgi:hypothetical protein